MKGYISLEPNEIMPKQIRVLLFDLGGVLIELNDLSTLLQLNDSEMPVNKLWSDWLSSPAARAFEMGIVGLFDQHFASHLTGKLKPDRESFEHVLQSLNCDPPSILFLDDNEMNVKAARSVGIIAYRTQGAQEAEKILEKMGILT